jgi:hypothetical protein
MGSSYQLYNIVSLVVLYPTIRITPAGVVKLVDTGDLKSPGIIYCTGSSPVSGKDLKCN